GGSPGMDLQESQAQFARQLVLAQEGDRSALESITQYADQYLSAGQDYYGSGTGYQSIRDDVLAALEDMPDQVSAEEYVADEIKEALLEQTASITGDLSDVLRGDNPSNIAGELAGYFDVLAGGIDGVLTEDQLALIMGGKATDAQIRAMIQSMDLNGDAVVSGLESVIVSGMPTDAILANVLQAQLKANGGKALTEAQVRKALSPIATDDQINKLMDSVDANGEGVISAQEIANGRLSGLSSGIAGALNPMFDKIDSSLDGLIDYGEFSKFFDGLASDERLRQIFSQLDTDGDGQISALEAVKQSTDQVGDNTGSLEERSLEQLQKLTGLTSEMARSTDQFIGLNSTMVSLRESINALGVAQKEAARIEKARQEAEAAAKERVALERKLSGYESTLDSLNSKLGSTQSDIKDLAKDRDTYDYVDYRNEHAAGQWSNIDKTYKGYTGYIGDENAYWEDGKLKTSG
ncbi:EF-hand domain-containing protein, partial [Salinicola sp. CPA57]|uniref:EF-hand domain-containing protein n=1 Tax=Salinicola sp. CPA57 TaxID=1949080 RepID=UPI00130051DD